MDTFSGEGRKILNMTLYLAPPLQTENCKSQYGCLMSYIYYTYVFFWSPDNLC